MDNKTTINNAAQANITKINESISGQGASGTVINNVSHNSNKIPVGTILCEKYKVMSAMDTAGGEADLFICEYNNNKYVAKLYQRDVAVKKDVITALKGITSPFIARLYDSGIYNGLPFEIIPYYGKGSLQGRTFSFEELKNRIIPSLNEGLNILHRNGIIHKDLKPSNIMLCDNEEDISIIDFGISSFTGGVSTVIVTKTGMTPEYSAPETFKNIFLEESDYYSLGITLYELFTGRTPYGNMSPEEIVQYLTVQRIPFPSNMPTELCNLIAGLTYNDLTHKKDKSNPNRRWTYKEVDNWCKGIYQQTPGETIVPEASQIPPYTFLHTKYTNIVALADALARNWEDGKKQLFRGLLSGFFKPVNPEIAGYCIDAEQALSNGGANADFLFFQTLYKISPSTRAFYWRGKVFESLPKLGDSILEHMRNEDRSDRGLYDEVLSRKLLSEYISIKDEKNEELKKVTENLEKRFIDHHSDEHEKELAYYLTGYTLSGQRTYVLKDKTYNSVDELVHALHITFLSSETDFKALCNAIIDRTGTLTEQFEAWLIVLGKHKELQEWKTKENAT